MARDIKWDVPPAQPGKVTMIELSTYEGDTRETVDMIDSDGNEVGKVRVGSIIHWLLIKNGGKVVRK